MTDLLRYFLDMVYPNKCMICQKKVNTKDGHQYICDECYHIMEEYKTSYELFDPKRRYDDTRGYAVFRYDGVIRHLIHRFKYGKERRLAKLFAELILPDFEHFIKEHYIEMVIPVPIHKERLEKRGFNQAELVARILSKKLKIPMETKVLTRIKNTKPQNELSFGERVSNVKDCFDVVNSSKIIYKDIILLDDIYTTGSTIEECSKVLREHNTRNVYFLSLSISNKNF